jgi:hypothetical protein
MDGVIVNSRKDDEEKLGDNHTRWWDTHFENVRETATEKLSHLIANALISCKRGRPLGDANKVKIL